MLTKLSELRGMITAGERKTCAVACAHDAHTLEAIMTVRNEGLMDCLLVGHTEEIKKIAADHGFTVADSEMIEAATDEEAAQICVDLVRGGKAGFILKGILQTGTLLKAVVNKQTGLNTGSVISHFALVELPGYPKLLGVCDSGMIPAPDLATKTSRSPSNSMLHLPIIVDEDRRIDAVAVCNFHFRQRGTSLLENLLR